MKALCGPQSRAPSSPGMSASMKAALPRPAEWTRAAAMHLALAVCSVSSPLRSNCGRKDKTGFFFFFFIPGLRLCAGLCIVSLQSGCWWPGTFRSRLAFVFGSVVRLCESVYESVLSKAFLTPSITTSKVICWRDGRRNGLNHSVCNFNGFST